MKNSSLDRCQSEIQSAGDKKSYVSIAKVCCCLLWNLRLFTPATKPVWSLEDERLTFFRDLHQIVIRLVKLSRPWKCIGIMEMPSQNAVIKNWHLKSTMKSLLSQAWGSASHSTSFNLQFFFLRWEIVVLIDSENELKRRWSRQAIKILAFSCKAIMTLSMTGFCYHR